LGAYIADTYLGRFNTICIAVFVALLGHIILVVAAVPGVIEHTSAVGAFAVALVVMGLGAIHPSGRNRSCNLTWA
jgi:POT family proton-dependent oligopeptide transporter